MYPNKWISSIHKAFSNIKSPVFSIKIISIKTGYKKTKKNITDTIDDFQCSINEFFTLSSTGIIITINKNKIATAPI